MADGSIGEADDNSGWETRYRQGRVPWDRGDAPRVLVELAQSTNGPMRVLCPGVGRGHDAFAWAEAGHDVVAFDVAPTAVSEAATLAADRELGLELLQADAFALPAELVGTFDIVWEQTFLCALDPEQRTAYIDVIAAMLRPSGVVHALLWNHGEAGGPPWDLTPSLARGLFSPRFEIESLKPVHGGARREEFVLRARVR